MSRTKCFADGCRTNDDCDEGICQENPLIGNSTCVSGACEIDDDCADFDCGSRDVFCAESTGMCTCTGYCEEGCSDTQFCCNTANACEDLPDPCEGVTCDPGQEAELTTAPSGNSDTCEVTAGACDCVDLPPLELGSVGRHSDSALLPGGGLAISAYNTTYGDLMVGILGANDEIAWTFVDGVPSDGNVGGAIDGPRNGVSTPGDDVGTHTSIAADSNGTLHVAYRDQTNQALKYAQGVSAGGDYTWTVYTLDTTGNAGLYTDITVGSGDVPAIAYMSATVVVNPDQPVAESRLIWLAASAAMPDDAGWTPTTLDFGDVFFACGGGCDSGECRLDTNVCESPAPASACNDSCGDGEACFGTTCIDIAVEGLDVLPEGVGLFASAVRTSDGSGAVAYYDRTGGDLRLVRQIGGAWQTPEILDGRAVDGTDTTDAGQFCNLFVDGDDNLHIAYVDAIADDLRYLDVTNMTSDVVDAGIRIGPDRVTRVFIGDDAKIAMDGAGNLVIVYQDATQHDLLVATQNGNAWQIVTIAGDGASYDGSYGFYNTHHYTGGESLITTFKYQRQTDPEESGIAVFRN